MSVAETWESPEWFTSSEPEPGLRIVIIDGSANEEQQLPQLMTAAGLDLPWGHWSDGRGGSPAVMMELREQLPQAQRCLAALRADARYARLPVLLSVPIEQLSLVDRAAGFDDFVLQPCTRLEVRARIRAILQRRQEQAQSSEPADGIVVDAVSHEVIVAGRTVRLTAREFALFAYLRARRGRVLSREHLLTRVWGHRYRGGPRTVDTHIGRLRLKFGTALPIDTVRTNGYRLRLATELEAPSGDLPLSESEPPLADDAPLSEPPPSSTVVR
jgi:two-component system phosphate regulon response regulator PhoB